MKATSQACKIELIDDFDVFYERTGLLYCYKDLESLGFKMFSFAGHFMATSAPALLDFCEKNPCYHIITVTGTGYYENRYIPGKHLYYLGDGDKNPRVVLNHFLNKNLELFAEERFAEALTMLDDVDRGDHGK